MNLTITQDNTRTETINSSIIDKLYEIAFAASSDPNSTVSLIGRLESPKGYKFKIDWLNTNFSPDLTITVPTSGQYILFEDSAVESLLISGGFSTDGTGISLTDAANATFTNSTFKNNTTITSFNEFPYFTKANTNPSTSLFEGCSNLEDIDLTSTTAISQYEFRRSGIKTANLPSLTSLGTESFAYCSNLETVTDLGNVTSIPNYCFRNNPKLSSVVLPTTVTYLGIMAFSNYNSGFNSVLTTITGLNNVRTFSFQSLCEHKSLNLDASQISSATFVGGGAFSWVPMTGVLNLKDLTQIDGEYAFYNGKYNKIQCLGKISTIPGRTFKGNTTTSDRNLLTEVYLPYECTSIGEEAFQFRSNLTTVKQYTQSVDNWVEGETPAYGDMTRITSLGVSAFKNSGITGVLDLPNLTQLGRQCFENCTGITGINSLGNITEIPGSCFFECTGITSITIPSNVVSIKEHAFSRSGNPITNLQLHSSITNIERGAFAKINYPNSCFYLPLLIGSTSTRDMFSYYYGNGGYMSQIGQLYLPHLINMTTTGHGSYPYWSGLFTCLKAQLVYLKDITDLYPGTFSNSDIQAIVINNTVPPTLNNSTDNRQEEGAYNTAIFNVVNNWSGFIYVPDGYVNTYISAWENVLDSTRGNSAGSTIRTDIVLKNRIKSISELPTYATEADWIAANRPLGLITAYMS